jgi:O-methyltransferase
MHEQCGGRLDRLACLLSPVGNHNIVSGHAMDVEQKIPGTPPDGVSRTVIAATAAPSGAARSLAETVPFGAPRSWFDKLKEGVKSVPFLKRIAIRAIGESRVIANQIPGVRSMVGDGPFFSLSPDLTIALLRAFTIQRDRNMLDGYGYFEFGMFRGYSMWFADRLAREYGAKDFTYYGFDSFAGLPLPQLDEERSIFFKGQFGASYDVVVRNLEKWEADLNKIKLFKGWYSEELFAQFKAENKFPKASICVIDVDLYDSCVPVLDFVKDFLVPGSILIFDDWDQLRKQLGPDAKDDSTGERRAVKEFEARYPSFRKEHIFDYGWEGAAFRVVAI